MKLLIADCFTTDQSSFSGAWVGDPVILASDDSGLPNPGDFVTATNREPTRNLNETAQAEFTNISYRALAELCQDPELAYEIVTKAQDDRSLLIDLGTTVEQYQLSSLEHAIGQVFGKPWRKAYNQALGESQHWRPLPAIDWPL